MEHENFDLSPVRVKEEPPEEFVLILLPPPVDEAIKHEPQEDIEPEMALVVVKEEPPEDYVLVLPSEAETATNAPNSQSKVEHQPTIDGAASKLLKGVESKQLTNFRAKSRSEMPASCPHCQRTFTQKGKIPRHMKVCPKLIPARNAICPHCHYNMRHQKRLINHLKICGKARPAIFECDVCGDRFQAKHMMRKHMLKHSSEGNFRCPECGFGFKTNITLQHHLRSKKTHKCLVCDIEFSCKFSQRRHRSEVHGSMYKCGKCSYQTKVASRFINHKGIHDKSIACSTCDGKFSSHVLLKNHQMQYKHGIYATAPDQTFNCDKCEKRFASPNYLREHQRKVHGDRKFQCKICQKFCKNKVSLYNHSRYHNKK